MNTKLIAALLIVLPLGVFSALPKLCIAGWKHKAALTNLKCTSAKASTAACGACCEKDTTKCGGNTVVCDSGKYQDPTKDGDAGGADDAARKKNCCSVKATCQGVSCVAGMKPKASGASINCASSAASCDTKTCCEKDTTKCGGNKVVCGSGKYQDPSKAANPIGTNNTAQQKNCCADKATCQVAPAATCAAGMKARASPASINCTSNAASCASGTCCELDATKCGGRTVKLTCNSTEVAKAADTAGTTKAECCMTKPAATPAPTMATCALFKEGSASGAKKTAMSLLFAVAGVVALWK